VKIEDLLEREPIELDKSAISRELSGKRILVTGAAGSIGSEIVRQIIPFNPAKLVLLDCAETPLHELELELKDEFFYTKAEIIIGDVRNEIRMRKVFETHLPEVVFHAAAYKHVPMMELNPSEAILTNVYGTRITADLSLEHNVKKFVMISTDKAVRPASMMGASKRIAEIYTHSLSEKGKTKFITTRFGNVLGSSGSVIPRFKKQIEQGLPLTVTHPEVTRFFMTIPEACQLVLEAAAMGTGGEIYIFDMGESVRIAELAKKMIRLSGLELNKDISIRYTGLRPGEKLFEELLNDKENTLPTHHQKIMIARVEAGNHNLISKAVAELLEMVQSGNENAIGEKVKEIIPEFQSVEAEAVNR
jgi:FlaA1/EpsC-like NDP-sugar epimerase